MESNPVQAAGGIVVSEQGQIVIVSQHGNSWSLPKGHVDPGEDHLIAARREIYEESGLTELELIKELGSYRRRRIGKGGVGRDTGPVKEINLFLFKTIQSDLQPIDPDNPEALWVSPLEAVEMLTHPKDKKFLEQQIPEIQKLIAK
jgi:8-oxo-dGTP pyrophosphatase MutT (NUDIX family)